MPRPFPLPALVLLAASCGASAPSPQPFDPDASADASAADVHCNPATHATLPGRGCVMATRDNCDGVRCGARQFCNPVFPRDAAAGVVCVMD